MNCKKKKTKSAEMADLIRNEITAGKLIPGERLGSVRDIAERFQQGRRIVLSAFTLLADEGLIIKKPKRGCFVNPNLEFNKIHERVKRIGFLAWKQKWSQRAGNFIFATYYSLLQSAEKLNCELVLGTENIDDPVKFYNEKELNALIVCGFWDDELGKILLNADIPFLFYGNRELSVKVNHINFGITENIYNVIKSIIAEYNFKRLGYITGPERFVATHEFAKGFRTAVKDCGLKMKDNLCYYSDNNSYAAIKEMMESSSEKPDFIFADVFSFPEIARYIFENHIKEEDRPFIMLEGWYDNMFYPELVNAVLDLEFRNCNYILNRMLDIYYGRVSFPYRETIYMNPPYYTTEIVSITKPKQGD